MIENYIRQLLFEKDFVAVPGLGGFVAQSVPAEIDSEGNHISPASKVIVFDSNLSGTDNNLALLISESEGIGLEDANQNIQNFIYKIRQVLNEGQTYQLEGVGQFDLNEDGDPIFKANENNLYLTESYGLPELELSPVNRKQQGKGKKSKPDNLHTKGHSEEAFIAVGEIKSKKKLKGIFWIVTVVLILSCLGGGAWYYFKIYKAKPEQETETDSLSNNEGGQGKQGEESQNLDELPPEKTEAGVADHSQAVKKRQAAEGNGHQTASKPEKKKKKAPELDKEGRVIVKDHIPKRTHKFYVVASSVKHGDNAFAYRQKLLAQGFVDADVLEPEKKGGWYRVVIGESETEAEAKDILKKAAPKFPPNTLSILK